VAAPCSVVGGYRRFGETFRLRLQCRNVGNYLQDYTASQPRRPRSTDEQILAGILCIFIALITVGLICNKTVNAEIFVTSVHRHNCV
jgi:hypothetical protein